MSHFNERYKPETNEWSLVIETLTEGCEISLIVFDMCKIIHAYRPNIAQLDGYALRGCYPNEKKT